MEDLCLTIGNAPQARAACQSSSEPAAGLVRLRIEHCDTERFQKLYKDEYGICLSFDQSQSVLVDLLCLLAVARNASPVVMIDSVDDHTTNSEQVTPQVTPE